MQFWFELYQTLSECFANNVKFKYSSSWDQEISHQVKLKEKPILLEFTVLFGFCQFLSECMYMYIRFADKTVVTVIKHKKRKKQRPTKKETELLDKIPFNTTHLIC